jgi:hypothetical protein
MRRWRLSIPALILLTATLPAAAAGQAQPETIDLSERGPQVGEGLPDFSLEDAYGETWTQDSILGENGAMLVFIRSADW